ncbi:MAG: UDP-forming cellulose synthase catalytic subunit, partial [Pseudomonas sp.]|nr:UDP-forming cellulose synthase catalytic subunit [Pseudomonas sp.]
IAVLMQRGHQDLLFPGIVSRSHENFISISFSEMSVQQKIDFVQCTFARANAWLDWGGDFIPDQPLNSFIEILKLGGRGYRQPFHYLPAGVWRLVSPQLRLLRWLGSYLPHRPTSSSSASSKEVSTP